MIQRMERYPMLLGWKNEYSYNDHATQNLLLIPIKLPMTFFTELE